MTSSSSDPGRVHKVLRYHLWGEVDACADIKTNVYTNDVFLSLNLTFSLVVGSGDNGGSRMGVGGRGTTD